MARACAPLREVMAVAGVDGGVDGEGNGQPLWVTSCPTCQSPRQLRGEKACRVSNLGKERVYSTSRRGGMNELTDDDDDDGENESDDHAPVGLSRQGKGGHQGSGVKRLQWC
jgi:hypothetical protein